MRTVELIGELRSSVEGQLAQIGRIRSLPLDRLQQRPAPGRWSVLEVVEHMNLSSGHYIRRLHKLYSDPGIALRMHDDFVPGRWGDLATNAMRPDPSGAISWKMKTLFFFEPRTAKTKGLRALDDFETMLRATLVLLDIASQRGLDGPKVTSTLGPVLRFKPGDAFRFPIGHQERHMLQVRSVLQALGLEASLAL